MSSGMEGCHNDGNRAHNVLGNLRWDTHPNNLADRLNHGTALLGEKHPRAKFTLHQRNRILNLIAKNFTRRRISGLVGCSVNTVSRAKRGEGWMGGMND